LSILQDADRDQRAILAIFALLLVRTAGHVRGHRRHAAGLGRLHGRGRHQRRENEPRDHGYRQKSGNQSAQNHAVVCHGHGKYGRGAASRADHVRASCRVHRVINAGALQRLREIEACANDEVTGPAGRATRWVARKIFKRGPRPRRSPLSEDAGLSWWCRPSWSSCRFRLRSWS
jgi:hypothetical protein